MSHVKRPWHAEKLPDGWYEIWADCDDGSRIMIAECVVAEHAALLAAAPDLLEAAKGALAAIELQCSKCDNRWCGGECFDASCAVHKAVACIEAAISKAEGRTED